jgi:hypothetical protein
MFLWGAIVVGWERSDRFWLGEERSLVEMFWWGAIAFWLSGMVESDRLLRCFGGVRSRFLHKVRSQVREALTQENHYYHRKFAIIQDRVIPRIITSLFGMFWWGAKLCERASAIALWMGEER